MYFRFILCSESGNLTFRSSSQRGLVHMISTVSSSSLAQFIIPTVEIFGSWISLGSSLGFWTLSPEGCPYLQHMCTFRGVHEPLWCDCYKPMPSESACRPSKTLHCLPNTSLKPVGCHSKLPTLSILPSLPRAAPKTHSLS